MVESEVQKNKRGAMLAVLLGVLGVAIVGLVVGIVVVNLQNNNDDNVAMVEEKYAYTLPKELMGDYLSSEDQVVKETSLMMQDPEVNVTDVEKYYDEVVGRAIDEGDMNLAVNIIIQKMEFLAVVEGNCAKAREYVDSLDTSFYSAEKRGYLESYVVSMKNRCDEIEQQEQEGV